MKKEVALRLKTTLTFTLTELTDTSVLSTRLADGSLFEIWYESDGMENQTIEVVITHEEGEGPRAERGEGTPGS